MTITDDEIKRLRALCEAATPGPYRASNGGLGVVSDARDAEWVCRVSRVTPVGDADYIAAACNALPKLLDEVALLREEKAVVHRDRLSMRSKLTEVTAERGEARRIARDFRRYVPRHNTSDPEFPCLCDACDPPDWLVKP